MIRRLFALLAAFALFFALAQERPDSTLQLPPSLQQRLDSLRGANNLLEWLYAHGDYVYEDPVNRFALLAEARRNAWRDCRDPDECLAFFNLLTGEGYYSIVKGDILRSIDAYEEAYRFSVDKRIPDAELIEYVLKPLGNNYTRLGDYDRALFIQQRLIALAKDSATLASGYHNIATTSRWRGDVDDAKRYCAIGIGFSQPGSAIHGLLLSTLAEILFLQNKTDSAQLVCREAIGILTPHVRNKAEPSAAYWLRGAWQGLGDILKRKKQYEEALNSYSRALRIVEQNYPGQRSRERAKLHVAMGEVLLLQKKSAFAALEFDRSLRLLLPSWERDKLPSANLLYGENTILDALHGKMKCFVAAGNDKAAVAVSLLMFDVGRELRGEFFGLEARKQRQKEDRAWTGSAMDAAFRLWKRDGDAAPLLLIAELSKSQLLHEELATNLRYSSLKQDDSLLFKRERLLQAISYYEKDLMSVQSADPAAAATQQRKQQLEFELSLLSKDLRERYPVLAASEDLPRLDPMLAQIPPGVGVVEFFVGDSNLYVLTLDRSGIRGVQQITQANALVRQIRDFSSRYFQQGAAAMVNQPQAYFRESYFFYRQLWPEAANHYAQVLIIPDGMIGFIPFEALVTDSVYRSNPADWPFLLRERNMFYGYSLQTWQQQKKIPREKHDVAGFFIASGKEKNSAIPAVTREYRALRKELKGRFLRDEQASLDEFRRELPRVKLLHISTHSYLQGEQAVPALQLWDSRFFLFELHGKSFRPQLVVLSACRTGHGIIAEGEGIISLARGFTAAGAGGIIAGLWNLNDEAAAALIQSFYRRLAQHGNPVAALREAKLEWLETKQHEGFRKLPYFWAGLVYAGNGEKIVVTATDPKLRGFLIAGMGLIILVTVFVFWKLRRRPHDRETPHASPYAP
ncbi:MAG TPA: CHAT domain-containing tetratricopeptide repeat protein [Chitinophagaceae bacterium]|nr:CHAT domain-containing tetratricopeptide repeat protein [Chitinophagaceae bacterium]